MTGILSVMLTPAVRPMLAVCPAIGRQPENRHFWVLAQEFAGL
jgi:hypothetical protein